VSTSSLVHGCVAPYFFVYSRLNILSIAVHVSVLRSVCLSTHRHIGCSAWLQVPMAFRAILTRAVHVFTRHYIPCIRTQLGGHMYLGLVLPSLASFLPCCVGSHLGTSEQ